MTHLLTPVCVVALCLVVFYMAEKAIILIELAWVQARIACIYAKAELRRQAALAYWRFRRWRLKRALARTDAE